MSSNIEESKLINEVVVLSSQGQKTHMEISGKSSMSLSIRDRLLIDKVKSFNNCIYVGNLDHRITKKELEVHFSRCGYINNIRILVSMIKGLHQGHAYIEFFDENSLFVASCLDGTYLYNKPIEVLPRKSNGPVSTSRYYTNIFGPFSDVEDFYKVEEEEEKESDDSSVDGEMTKEEMARWQRNEAVMRVRRWRVTQKPY
ncbi:PREDICTED: polyadenylate-binding protein 2-like [Nicrophorus vespilloides]|uniref:Polyadenylate-binding protein 2-like n=1 Tax=Nicrophorus vespilloides TaxID=110193 RepID=A0ABM1N0S9_NICVS|nr:PREDICTED: polyadenylate-binding protein 2-like [Nicrophorus vespilloides]